MRRFDESTMNAAYSNAGMWKMHMWRCSNHEISCFFSIRNSNTLLRDFFFKLPHNLTWFEGGEKHHSDLSCQHLY